MAALPLVLAFASMAAATAVGSAALTKGTIPVDAIGADGRVDVSLIPDFVVTLGRDGKPVGYVTRKDALDLSPRAVDESGRPVDVPYPVYADDLTTVVGYMVAGRGFVPLGVDPLSVPTFEVREGLADVVAP